jgi:hypothetical protein
MKKIIEEQTEKFLFPYIKYLEYFCPPPPRFF